MKKKLSFMFFAVIAMVAISVATSCGGDDDDDTPGGSSEFIGVHRMDVQFSGNFEGLDVKTIFTGVKADGSVSNLYENGKAVEGSINKVWISEEVRSFSIQTENNCGAIVASVYILTDKERPSTSDVSVTMVGYINNKRVVTKVFTFPAGKHSFGFNLSTDEGGKGDVVIDNEVIWYEERS